MKISDLEFKELDSLDILEEGKSYLCECHSFCSSGYHVATLENGVLVSESTGEDMYKYATHILEI